MVASMADTAARKPFTGIAEGTVDAVEIKDLTVRFDQVTALDAITHRFEPGTSTAVMGVNGSGKTTLLECLAGLKEATSGTISGVPENLGYVCQHGPATWMPVTAGEVLAMGRYRRLGLLGRFRSKDRAAMDHAAQQLDVNGLRSRSFGELSGGQQQRVRIAQALATEPDVVMLDEPITGLDLPSQQRILNMVNDCAERGAVVIITTHHLEEARSCDSVMLLANRLVAAGPPDEVLTAERLRDAFGHRLLTNRDSASEDSDPNQDTVMIDDHGHSEHAPHDSMHQNPMHCDPYALRRRNT